MDRWKNKEDVRHTDIHSPHRNVTQPLKKNLAIWDNMNGLRGHYGKQNMSDRERQIYDLIYYSGIETTKQNKKTK